MDAGAERVASLQGPAAESRTYDVEIAVEEPLPLDTTESLEAAAAADPAAADEWSIEVEPPVAPDPAEAQAIPPAPEPSVEPPVLSEPAPQAQCRLLDGCARHPAQGMVVQLTVSREHGRLLAQGRAIARQTIGVAVQRFDRAAIDEATCFHEAGHGRAIDDQGVARDSL